MGEYDSAFWAAVRAGKEVCWQNDGAEAWEDCRDRLGFAQRDADDAAERLMRFAPVIEYYFPETAASRGIIESPLTEIPHMAARLAKEHHVPRTGRMFLKRDSDLPVSGSVKARGGIYEVLAHTEQLALEAGLLKSPKDDYLCLATPEARELFGRYKIQVGSTGNLGLSIGIMSAALGYHAIVHMSADAKQWKKDLLRARGAEVREYAGDYGLAVRTGREQSDADPMSYFVDDEHSRHLFLGYAVAGRRLKTQLDAAGITIDNDHPLCVYIPCGVGGAPGGITFGLKLQFGDAVQVYFAEPTQAPCMLVGLASGRDSAVSVEDFGLTGRTEADGLAVGRCSSLVAPLMHPLLSGESTVSDERLEPLIRDLWQTEGLFIEPSAGAAFAAYIRPAVRKQLPQNAVHIIWATGGSMVPAEERAKILGDAAGV